jgi:hypothetical protein
MGLITRTSQTAGRQPRKPRTNERDLQPFLVANSLKPYVYNNLNALLPARAACHFSPFFPISRTRYLPIKECGHVWRRRASMEADGEGGAGRGRTRLGTARYIRLRSGAAVLPHRSSGDASIMKLHRDMATIEKATGARQTYRRRPVEVGRRAVVARGIGLFPLAAAATAC